MKNRCRSLFVLSVVCMPALAGADCPVRDAHDLPPPDWDAQATFKLSVQYPQELPVNPEQPWKKFDFRTDWQGYMNAVLAYVREGNEEIGWYVERNQKRRWFHSLWMDRSDSGREFVHGLTRERPPRRGDLLPDSKANAQSWAVGFYNDVGGYTLGQVWKNPCNPDASKALFPEGTVSFKLLFTTATPGDLPFLKDTLRWRAHVWTSIEQQLDPKSRSRFRATPRKLANVHLMQLDIAVRDNNASGTGWVFGTFVYRGDAPGATVFDRMVPISLQWGNDPEVLPGGQLQETRINQELAGKHFGWKERPWLGWHGRANGPVDNKESSCMSCHGSAQFPRSIAWGNLYSANPRPPREKIRDDAHRLAVYFRNVKAGEVFDPTTPGARSLDYSLQLQAGLERMCEAFGAESGGVEYDLAKLPLPDACKTRKTAIKPLSAGEAERFLKLTVKGAEVERVSKKP